MLISKTVFIKWNSKNKQHYVDLGYKYTKMGDEFEIDINHASKGCSGIVEYVCDFCGKKLYNTYTIYYSRRKTVMFDSCDNIECQQQKAKMCLLEKYGVDCVRRIPGVSEKTADTNRSKYGCGNPFGNKDVQEKIYQTNYRKYGCKVGTQCETVIQKSIDTVRNKYGVDYFVELFKGKYIRENSPCWKGGKEITPRNRQDYFYTQWRKSVFERDDYTCQKCHDRSSSGHPVVLEGHHIENWLTCEEKRYDVDNGITLCHDCHKEFHHKYGRSYNTNEQIQEFLSYDEKVC